MTDDPSPFAHLSPAAVLLIHRLLWTDDEEAARTLRRRAYQLGASGTDIARAARMRDERMASDVVRIYTGGSIDRQVSK